MIRESVMRARDFDLWHMASGTVVLGCFAHPGCRLPAAVACHALGIVMGHGVIDFLVRIVAGHTTNAPVFGVIALAIG